MHRDAEIEPKAEAGERPDHPPRVANALKSDVSVSVTSWSGRQLQGTVSDRDEAGLLLDLDEMGRRDGKVTPSCRGPAWRGWTYPRWPIAA